MAFVKPTLSFELGLTAGFRDLLGSVAWTDVTPYVVTWGVGRGREPKKPPSHFEPGNASLLLNNRDRRFDPTNTAGPYTPNLKPARVRLRIRGNYPSRLAPAAQDLESTASTGWTSFVNCTVASSTAQARSGTKSLAITAVGAGTIEARVITPAVVSAGEQMTFILSVRPNTTARNFTLNIEWRSANGSIISTTVSSVFTETAGAWADLAVTTTAPAGAAQALPIVSITGAAAGEVHYIDQASFHPGAGITWAAPYDIFTGYIKRWPPQWSATATSTVAITAVDALGAPLNLAQIYGTLWETAVRHDKPKVWLRMDETSGTVAADSTTNRLDGQFQGTPTLGQPSLLFTDTAGKAVRFVAGSRASLPYKNLLAGYPFTFECWFTCGPDTVPTKVFLSAYDGGAAPIRQILDIRVDTTNPGKIVARVSNPAGTGSAREIISTIAVNDSLRHHLVWVATSATDTKLYIDGVDRTSVVSSTTHAFPNNLTTGYAIGNTPAVAFGDFRFGAAAEDVLDEIVIYDTALTPARITKHYGVGIGYGGPTGNSGPQVVRMLEEADWPGDYAVDSGEAQLQNASVAGSVVANLQKIEDSEQGALFVDESGRIIFQGRYALNDAPYNTSQVTLEQGVGTLVYEAPVTWGNDDAELFNSAAGNRIGGATYTVRDQASVTDYGERPLSAISGLWNRTDGEVVDLLTYRVKKYAQPVSSVRQVRLHPAAVPELYPHILGLGLRERVTIKVAPPGGGPVFSQESHIERITHEVDASGDWWTVWDVSAADTTLFWTLNHATLGRLDAGSKLGL